MPVGLAPGRLPPRECARKRPGHCTATRGADIASALPPRARVISPRPYVYTASVLHPPGRLPCEKPPEVCRMLRPERPNLVSLQMNGRVGTRKWGNKSWCWRVLSLSFMLPLSKSWRHRDTVPPLPKPSKPSQPTRQGILLLCLVRLALKDHDLLRRKQITATGLPK